MFLRSKVRLPGRSERNVRAHYALLGILEAACIVFRFMRFRVLHRPCYAVERIEQKFHFMQWRKIVWIWVDLKINIWELLEITVFSFLRMTPLSWVQPMDWATFKSPLLVLSDIACTEDTSQRCLLSCLPRNHHCLCLKVGKYRPFIAFPCLSFLLTLASRHCTSPPLQSFRNCVRVVCGGRLRRSGLHKNKRQFWHESAKTPSVSLLF